MSIVYNDTIQYPNLNPPKPCSFNINLFCSNTGHLAQGTLSFWSKAIILDSSEAGYHTFTLRAVPAQKKNGTVDLEHVALEGHTLCVYIFIYIYMSYGRNCLFGEYAISKYGGPLSVFRVLHVLDITIKAEACNLHCGMIRCATWSRNCRRASQDVASSFVLLTTKANDIDDYKVRWSSPVLLCLSAVGCWLLAWCCCCCCYGCCCCSCCCCCCCCCCCFWCCCWQWRFFFWRWG